MTDLSFIHVHCNSLYIKRNGKSCKHQQRCFPVWIKQHNSPFQVMCWFATVGHFTWKDTVLFSTLAFGWSRHVQQHQLGSLRLLDHDLIQFHCCVHSSHVSLIPMKNQFRQWQSASSHTVKILDMRKTYTFSIYRIYYRLELLSRFNTVVYKQTHNFMKYRALRKNELVL